MNRYHVLSNQVTSHNPCGNVDTKFFFFRSEDHWEAWGFCSVHSCSWLKLFNYFFVNIKLFQNKRKEKKILLQFCVQDIDRTGTSIVVSLVVYCTSCIIYHTLLLRMCVLYATWKLLVDLRHVQQHLTVFLSSSHCICLGQHMIMSERTCFPHTTMYFCWGFSDLNTQAGISSIDL